MKNQSKQTKKQENEEQYCKIPKTSLQRPFLRGLSTEGNLRFKIDWASLVFGSKFTVFALFYVVFEGNFIIFGVVI